MKHLFAISIVLLLAANAPAWCQTANLSTAAELAVYTGADRRKHYGKSLFTTKATKSTK